MKDEPKLLSRIYRLKLLLVGAILVVLGLLASAVSDLFEAADVSHLLVALISGLSDVLLVAGAIGIAVDFFTGRDKDAADTERLRNLLKEAAPDFRDAVIAGFAETPDSMRGVATPETLDKLATNAMSLRLGDKQFAREIYADVRDQAIRSAERWHDVEITIRLSAIAERSTGSAPLFDVLVEWEYTTTPSQEARTFACVSDRAEYRDLASDVPATMTWLMAPRPGLDASQREAFELLYFDVDGEEQTIRRRQRKGGQSYVVHMNDDIVRDGRRVRIRHIYRTRTTQAGHFLFVEVPQPARGLGLTVDFEQTQIGQLRVTDLLTSSRRTQIVRRPDITGEKSVSVDHAGWVLPRAGVAIAWTLLSEEGAAADALDAPAA